MKEAMHGFSLATSYLVLFGGFFLLFPVLVTSKDTNMLPWLSTPHAFFESVMLITVGGFLLYRLKEEFGSYLSAAGVTILGPALITIVLKAFSVDGGLTGMSFIDVAITSRLPSFFAVSGLYICIGAMLFWSGRIRGVGRAGFDR